MLNFVHIGIGQCGNRFAEQFGKHGRIAMAINTARIDMSNLDNKAISPRNQIHIALNGAKDGAGRDPEIGRVSMENNLDMVYDAIMKATSAKPADRFVLWAGLGGGTGTGGIVPLMNRLTAEGHKVMLGVTLPRKKEGWMVRMNAIKTLSALIGSFDENPKVIVPYIVIDNQKISGSLDSANEIIVSNLVRFTNTTKNIPAASAFDDTDYSRILNYRGVVSLARTTVPLSNLKGSDTLAKALQDAWEKSLLANFDSQDATGAATLVIAPEKFLNQKGNKEVLTENIDTIESLYPRANPYSCVYAAKNDHIDSIIVYTLLTGLAAPDDSLDEMYDDVSEQVEMDKARRRSRLQQERKSRAKRRILDYDPNNVDDDEDVPPEEDGPKFSL